MGVIERILCPTDFSEASARAFAYAQRLAKTTGAEMLVLHVVDAPDFWASGGAAPVIDPEIEALLREIKPADAAVKVEHLAHIGSAGEVICWIGQQRQCDAIVMGTHGRTGLAHLFLGSVAEYVMQHARSPVVTVRLRPENEPPLSEPQIHYHVPPVM